MLVRLASLVLLAHLAFRSARTSSSPFVAVRQAPISLHHQVHGIPRTLHAAESTEGGSGSSEEQLVGLWRYIGGLYQIMSKNGKLFFCEGHLSGELKQQDEWLMAVLPSAGTIRLTFDASAGKVNSQFKQEGQAEWGDVITAVKEWSTLSQRGKELESELVGLNFEGYAEGSGVMVAVDGNQRPTAVRIPAELATAENLGQLIVEAHTKASEESLEAMTERLRKLYATHAQAPGTPIQ